MSAERLLQRLRDGGEIVSTAQCSEAEIVVARAAGRIWVDDAGFGYLYRIKSSLDRAKELSAALEQLNRNRRPGGKPL